MRPKLIVGASGQPEHPAQRRADALVDVAVIMLTIWETQPSGECDTERDTRHETRDVRMARTEGHWRWTLFGMGLYYLRY
jgi:hypothetical protein